MGARTIRLLGATLIALLIASCDKRPSHRFDEGSVIMLGGDTYFGESYAAMDKRNAALTDAQRYTDPQAGIAPLVAGSALTVVNFEGPVSPELPSRLQDKKYVHWADIPKTVSALKQLRIDAVSLANNHSMDQGRDGLSQSLANLASAKIATVGAGANLPAAASPLIRKIALPGGGTKTVAIVGMFEQRAQYRDQYGFYADMRQPGAAPIDPALFGSVAKQIRAKYPDAFIIAYPHWGENYAWATQEQARLARRLIDQGADMVVGHHAHVMQEVERYKGAWILYGIGNFLFNTPGRYDGHDQMLPYGTLVGVSFGAKPDDPPVVRLFPTTADNEASGYRPRLASAAQDREIVKILGGRDRSAGFGASIVSDKRGPAIELQAQSRFCCGL